MDKKAPNFLEQFWIMLFRIGRYGELSALKFSKIILFIIGYSILMGFLFIGAIFGKVQLMYGGIEKVLEDNIPDFTFSNHELNIENEIVEEYSNQQLLLCIKTNVNEFTSNDIDYLLKQKPYSVIVLIGKSNTILYSGGKIDNTYYKSFQFSSITKTEFIKKMMEYVKLIKFLIPFCILAYLIGHPLNAVLLMLLGFIISAIFQKKLKAGQLYKISIYVYGATMIWGLVSFMLPLYLPAVIQYFIYMIVAIVYMIFAIMATDFYNHNSVLPLKQQESFENISMPATFEASLFDDKDNPFSMIPLELEEVKNNVAESVKSKKSIEPMNPVPPKQIIKPLIPLKNQGNIEPEPLNDNSVQAVNISANSQTEGGISVLRNQLNIINVEEPALNEPNSSAIQKATRLVPREKPRVSASDDFGAYTPADYTRPISKLSLNETTSNYQGSDINSTGTHTLHSSDMIMICGTCCKKSDLDLVDKFILVGLDDDAVKKIQEILKCDENHAADIISNWSNYYKP